MQLSAQDADGYTAAGGFWGCRLSEGTGDLGLPSGQPVLESLGLRMENHPSEGTRALESPTACVPSTPSPIGRRTAAPKGGSPVSDSDRLAHPFGALNDRHLSGAGGDVE